MVANNDHSQILVVSQKRCVSASSLSCLRPLPWLRSIIGSRCWWNGNRWSKGFFIPCWLQEKMPWTSLRKMRYLRVYHSYVSHNIYLNQPARSLSNCFSNGLWSSPQIWAGFSSQLKSVLASIHPPVTSRKGVWIYASGRRLISSLLSPDFIES